MGHIQNSKPVAPTRRFVLADKFSPKATHHVEATESTAFGGATPVTRHSEREASPAAQTDLQDSIKSILSEFK